MEARYSEDWRSGDRDRERRERSTRSGSRSSRGDRERKRPRSPGDERRRESRRDETSGRRRRDDRDRERERDDTKSRRSRRRSRSPDSVSKRRRTSPGRERRGKPPVEAKDVKLPHGARMLVKGDFENFLPLLGYYLRIQKQKEARAMDDRELRGRWKSFMSKWNGGVLAEGWYDAHIWESARRAWEEELGEEPVDGYDSPRQGRNVDSADSNPRTSRDERARNDASGDDDDDDDDMGPVLPPTYRGDGAQHTVSAPRLEDLKLRDELNHEESAQARSDRLSALRHARKLDRRDQKERLDDLAPRADAGSHERRLEKKREVTEKMRDFARARSPGGGDAEVDDGELMGSAGFEGSLEAAKREKEMQERKKSEREVRREEIWRARMAEREERVQEYKDREEGTIKMLRELAKNAGRNVL